MARAKKDKKLVVNQAYFELIELKSKFLDDLVEDSDGEGITVTARRLKELDKINVAWAKSSAGDFEGTEESYEAPPAE